ncbi:MAG: hemerythrin domain-containing protein [Armatimonadetes bacterium]|nr:MAG: hemerythrin domain-containing protein [Armatimonadota bacterium]
MCEFCGCRRIPEIARLGAEHDTIQEIAEDVLASAGKDITPVELLEKLRRAVEPHVLGEEAGVFTQARAVGISQNYWVDDLEDDHKRFAEILADPSALSWSEIESFLDDLHRHIAIEEYDLFPALVRTLSDDDWAAVERRATPEKH